MDIAAAVSSGWIQVSNKFFSRENNEAIMGLIDKYFHLLLTNWPQVEEKLLKYTWHIIDIFFSPKQILRQLGLVFAIQSALLIGSGFEHLFSYLYQTFTENGKKVKEIHLQMEQARSYDEWKLLAEAEDRIHGYDKWRESDESTMYDCRVLNKRISDLNLMIEQNRIFDIMFRLRGGLARDQYGMQHEGLYTRARGGTKKIVEKYHETVASALNLVCDGMASAGEEPIPIDAKLAFFNEARHAYGRTALLLSGIYIFVNLYVSSCYFQL